MIGTLLRLFAAASVCLPATLLASSISISQGIYKMGKAPEFGDRLPVKGPVFHVYSEGGEDYNFVGKKNESLTFVTTLQGYCSSPRRAGDATVEIAGVTGTTYVGGGKRDYHREQITVDVPHARLGKFNAVKACNDGLRSLAAESGMSRRELIAKGFSLRYEDIFEAHGVMYCSGGAVRGHVAGDRAPVDVWVACAANPKAAEQAPKRAENRARPPPPLVRRLEFEVDRPNQIGKCPTGVTFTGNIVAGRKGTVKYRTVGHDGSKSPVFSLTFDGPNSKPISKWGETFKAPDPSGQLATGEGESGPTYKGWRRLEIVEPAGVKPSVRAEYRIICLSEPLMIEAQPVKPEPQRAPARIKAP